MGTPAFAVESLNEILKTQNEVVAVFTQPDKLWGRRKILKASEVKLRALECGILIEQPEKIGRYEVDLLKSFNPDVVVVVAYGRILPKAFLEVPRFGCVNIHASLLPRHRGASPIQSSIASGDLITGVSAMFLNERMDAGDVIDCVETPILENETAVELSFRLSKMGAGLVCRVLSCLKAGVVHRTVQNEKLATYAPILTRQSGRIDFRRSAFLVHRLVCAMVSWPVAFCMIGDKVLKVHRSVVTADRFNLKAGEVCCEKNRFVVGCGDGNSVEFLEVQLEGRKKMDASSFLNGMRLKSGIFLD